MGLIGLSDHIRRRSTVVIDFLYYVCCTFEIDLDIAQNDLQRSNKVIRYVIL